ncbi:MAG: hypothetical protein AAFY15_03450 [Cyanobacteria bacterium J06648_11]
MTRPFPNDATPHAVPFRRLRSLAGGHDPSDRGSTQFARQPATSLPKLGGRDRNELDLHLTRLVRGVYSTPPHATLRQQLLTELIRTITRELWTERSPETTDAVHHVLHYISANLSRVAANEWQTGVHSSFIDGFEADCRAYRSKPVPPTEVEDLGDELSLRLDAILVYITADPWGDWTSSHFPGRPDITCQLVTLQRLQHLIDWETLAAKCHVADRELASFFQKQCLPKLRQLPL